MQISLSRAALVFVASGKAGRNGERRHGVARIRQYNGGVLFLPFLFVLFIVGRQRASTIGTGIVMLQPLQGTPFMKGMATVIGQGQDGLSQLQGFGTNHTGLFVTTMMSLAL